MRYEAPTSMKDAVGLLAKAKGKAAILAGGTDLLVQLKSGLVEPDVIVDIKHIKTTQEITKTKSGFKVGASVSGARMRDHKALNKAWPGVVEATNLIGSDQVQGRCTMAGNLCNASPAADSVPALVAAKAKAVVVGPKGKRTVPVEKIPTGPGSTSLKKGEIIEAITLPNGSAKTGDAYLRFTPRTEMDIAVCSAGVCLTLGARGVIKTARIAIGAVAPTVVLAPKAARAIVGTKLDDEALEKLAKEVEKVCAPIDDKRGTIEFRTEVAGVLAKRAARIAYERAGGK
ncbi:MAG: xanthine dehydrogenase family protein subunit M [Pseudomonadales bacterium]